MINHRTNVMSMSSCFWALLSLPDYEILYLPTSIMNTRVDQHSIKDLLLGKPFINFIHPDERSLAKNDFNKFTDLDTLAGAVTRCRLRKLDCIARYHHQDRGTDLDWIVVDVIMYTAAENIILAFFHCDQGYPACPHTLCDDEKETEINGMHCLPSLFQRYNDNRIIGHMSNHQELSIGTLRAFQLYNNVTQNTIMTWPTKEQLPASYDNIVDAIQDDFYNAIQQHQLYPTSRNKVSSTSCTYHTRSTSNILLDRHGILRFEKILIQYGQLIFAVFRISSPRSSSPDHHHHPLPQPIISSPSLSSITTSSSPITSSSSPIITTTNTTTTTTTTTMNSMKSLTTIDTDNDHVPSKRNSPSSSSPSSSSSRSWRIRPNEKKRCESCQTSQSPEWRRGPSGHRTLCNACGLRYSRSLARQEQRTTLSPIISHASIQQQQQNIQQNDSIQQMSQSSDDLSHHHARTKYPGQRRFFNLYP
ncbi:uncharacterized protein BX664DRAFT_354599 [Halteromyces radiatus]|uniref:uncharacterized protein n=1 Tax=Halteromyces radiatus TaxID=101107 RepID=UPI00221F2966|nr:uncharacterized protein BX664DRAFT_354599 [Halteromyces radiatus]KAI8099125.1 hypothetical protein BX664DRAFT_354599 [Halteromyces radiatus]